MYNHIFFINFTLKKVNHLNKLGIAEHCPGSFTPHFSLTLNHLRLVQTYYSPCSLPPLGFWNASPPMQSEPFRPPRLGVVPWLYAFKNPCSFSSKCNL